MKMVIMRSIDGTTLCSAKHMEQFIEEGMTIEKVFDANTWREASQVMYDLEGWGEYIPDNDMADMPLNSLNDGYGFLPTQSRNDDDMETT